MHRAHLAASSRHPPPHAPPRQEQGQDVSIVNAVAAIDNCAREPIGRLQCTSIRGELE